MIPSDIPARLRAALERSEKTARQVADQIGVSESTVSLWLSGRRNPRVENLKKIAAALGVEASELWEGPQATPATAPMQSVVDDMAALDPTQQEAIAAMVRSIREAAGKK